MERFSQVEIFLKKVIPFEVLLFYPFYRNDRNLLYHLFGLPLPGFRSSRDKAKNLPVFCKWYNSIPFLFSVPKKIPAPFDRNFSPKLKMVSALNLARTENVKEKLTKS